MLEGLASYSGQAAGLATSMLWTGSSLSFTGAARRLGATVVNGYRLGLAVGLHAVTHRWLYGTWFPSTAAGQMAYLALSGLVGLTIGDQALLLAYLNVGPRIASLVMTTAPIMAALFGWAAMGERIGPHSLAAIAVTMGGVAWVVMERTPPAKVVGAAVVRRGRGLALAFVGAACQAGGLMLSKQGMGVGWVEESARLGPQSATLVRMAFAAITVTPIVLWHANRPSRGATAASGDDAAAPPRGGRACGGFVRAPRFGGRRAGYALATCGTLAGPYLGVWMSLTAAERVNLGVAQTLCSLTPIFILPFAHWLHGERITARAVVGAFVAVAGLAYLVLYGD